MPKSTEFVPTMTDRHGKVHQLAHPEEKDRAVLALCGERVDRMVVERFTRKGVEMWRPVAQAPASRSTDDVTCRKCWEAHLAAKKKLMPGWWGTD